MSREEKRKVLLQAASEALMEYGPHKTTLDDIARRAGMSKTSLYYYFRDKNEIVRAIIQGYTEQLIDLMKQAAASKKSAEDRMFALIEARSRFLAEKTRHAPREVIQEFRSLEGVFETEKELYLRAHLDLVRGILEDGVSRGEMRPLDNLELISLVLISSMFGCDRTFAFYDRPDRMMEAMKQMNRIFFTGLRNDSGAPPAAFGQTPESGRAPEAKTPHGRRAS
ncbi:MAG TPA: TetR/AcrR family transcriptional regulator [Deltaproteobacteria bacterium]|nr:TetR/AcrR family transcriptional regulator [Deltaproteobacteria bacterium]